MTTTDAAWSGPFVERTCRDEYTDASYVRCSDCGIEVIVEDTARALHREGCRHE